MNKSNLPVSEETMSGRKWRSRYATHSQDGVEEQTHTVDGSLLLIDGDPTTTASTLLSSSGKFTTADVISANQTLLNAISRCDYHTYNELCADDLTAFEPESNGMLISGKSFHKFYFDFYGGGDNTDGGQDADVATTADNKAAQSATKINITMSNPHVRWLGGGCCSDGCGDGSAAVISYVRIDQSVDSSGPVTRLSSETRVWENRDGRLVHVHFHKS
mmetsp:Transcript_32192/g.54929  ORF Transcript_32192/g.54929 Transcript_32192/m.54929 type:complete len:218 (-) Transcript_32192:955-1608(-)